MNKQKFLIYSSLAVLLLLGILFSPSNAKNDDFAERVKISLRDAGNQLLLKNQDSTSLILPVKEIGEFKYELSFQNQLSFEPSSIVDIIKASFQKTNLSNYYRVEVIQCLDDEVAYSYEILNQTEKDIIPCKGRILPKKCYTIEVKFTQKQPIFFSQQFFINGLIVLVFLFAIHYLILAKRNNYSSKIEKEKPTKIGCFQFYEHQNKLVKQATEISLSKKECELLSIFVTRPNEIIKRDELTKKVWEDNGVFVSRSLDTYISKLRKKLKEDSSIKLTNVHGVGYKLEILETKTK